MRKTFVVVVLATAMSVGGLSVDVTASRGREAVTAPDDTGPNARANGEIREL
jgi:hypothetical protein